MQRGIITTRSDEYYIINPLPRRFRRRSADIPHVIVKWTPVAAQDSKPASCTSHIRSQLQSTEFLKTSTESGLFKEHSGVYSYNRENSDDRNNKQLRTNSLKQLKNSNRQFMNSKNFKNGDTNLHSVHVNVGSSVEETKITNSQKLSKCDVNSIKNNDCIPEIITRSNQSNKSVTSTSNLNVSDKISEISLDNIVSPPSTRTFSNKSKTQTEESTSVDKNECDSCTEGGLNRSKRSTVLKPGAPVHVETAVFVDKDLFQHMALNFPTDTERELVRVVLAMINAVSEHLFEL